jgi:hypothetical protein
VSLEHEDRPPADAADALRVIQVQQAEATRRLNPDVRFYYWPWGLAWLIGFGLFFLRFGPGGRIFVNLPGWLPLTTLFVLLAVAGAVSGIAAARAYGQIAGESSRRGAWWGLTWLAAYAGMATILGRVSANLPEDLEGLLWAASAVGITGMLHMAGGAIWLDRNLFALGVWVTISNIVGVLAGTGWHSLIVSLAGGGGMLLAGTIAWMGTRNPP